jgi:hypothetical protein
MLLEGQPTSNNMDGVCKLCSGKGTKDFLYSLVPPRVKITTPEEKAVMEFHLNDLAEVIDKTPIDKREKIKEVITYILSQYPRIKGSKMIEEVFNRFGV